MEDQQFISHINFISYDIFFCIGQFQTVCDFAPYRSGALGLECL